MTVKYLFVEGHPVVIRTALGGRFRVIAIDNEDVWVELSDLRRNSRHRIAKEVKAHLAMQSQ
jgi:hypothetical protein